MENQPRAGERKRRCCSRFQGGGEDRISQLPQHILQNHILSLLSQNEAVGTCLLSKSWRYLGLTRPKFEFYESDFSGSNEKFVSFVEKTLQRYVDQNLSIQEINLEMLEPEDSESISLLNKWIPIVITNMGVKMFNLLAYDFSLPSVVFQAELLEELKLVGCKLDQIKNNNCIINVKLQVLKRLSLHEVYIEEETFEKIMSSCPSIQHLVLEWCCKGLSNVKVNKSRNFKHFDFRTKGEDKIIEIDDAPSLETIRIEGYCRQILYHHKNYFFPRLKSLYLWSVHLPTEFLNNLSSDNCPCLEELQLHKCFGFTEFELSNCSIKRLIINLINRPIKAAIDAANMLYFEYKSCYLPTISFSPTSRDWKSQIEVSHSNVGVLSNWDLKLHEYLISLSQSQISLDFSLLPDLTNKDTYDGVSCEPVVVEHLCFKKLYSSLEIPVLLNCLFRICRPRYIGLSMYEYPPRKIELADSVRKTFLEKGESKFWQQDLEESSIQVLEWNAHEWRPGQVCEFSNSQELRFRLKWREI